MLLALLLRRYTRQAGITLGPPLKGRPRRNTARSGRSVHNPGKNISGGRTRKWGETYSAAFNAARADKCLQRRLYSLVTLEVSGEGLVGEGLVGARTRRLAGNQRVRCLVLVMGALLRRGGGDVRRDQTNAPARATPLPLVLSSNLPLLFLYRSSHGSWILFPCKGYSRAYSKA